MVIRMDANHIVLIFICIFASGLFMVAFATYQIFINTLFRSDKKKRIRECSEKGNEAQREIFTQGIKWSEQCKEATEEVHIINDGLNLYGEYKNFGYDKCAIIIQGRTESLLYSYFYADVYAKNGYNILVIDTRAHGLSDGKYITAGIIEYRDVILWIELIKDRYSIKSFLIHGVCIGAATAIYAYCATKKDNLIKKMVLDGIFTSYYEIFKNHIIERKRPVLFFVYLVFFVAYLSSGARLLKETPFKRMKEIEIPILFLWSKDDIYCTMEKNQELFAECKSKYKEVKFFPSGRHSFVKYNNAEDYDKTIAEFLSK